MTRVRSRVRTTAHRVVATIVAGIAIGPLLWAPTPAKAETIRERSWYLDAMRVERAHDVTRGDGVVVAVVDSGVDATHPDLSGQVLDGTMFGGEGDPHVDPDGHGTGMASLIAGKGGGDNRLLGVAPGAKILPVRLAENDDGTGGYVHDMVDAVRWAIDNGAKVVNLSLGASEGLEAEDQAALIRYALQHDVVLVAAAGNSGDEQVEYPAAIPGVIAVSGTEPGEVLWDKSSWGDGVVVAAPAKGVPVAVPRAVVESGYALADGTSAATALVSGVVALIRSRYPKMSAGNVVNRLIRTARDLGSKGRDSQYGFGLVDAYQAVTAKVPHTTTYPLALPEGVASPHYPAPSNDDVQAVGDAPATRRDRLVAITAIATFFAVVVILLIPLVRLSLRNSAPRPAPVPQVSPGPAVGSARVVGPGMPARPVHPPPV